MNMIPDALDFRYMLFDYYKNRRGEDNLQLLLLLIIYFNKVMGL